MGITFSTEILVPDGNSSGPKVVSQINWTDVVLNFTRDEWKEMFSRDEVDKTLLCIMIGCYDDDSVLPILYNGQTD